MWETLKDKKWWEVIVKGVIVIAIAIAIAIAIVGMVIWNIPELEVWQRVQALGYVITVAIASYGVYVANLRAKAMEENAKAMAETAKAGHAANEQKAYNEAVTNLGNSDSTSARLGGIYGLLKLARDKPDRHKNITEILCAHLRETTQSEDYQKQYESKPSNEIQSLLNVLCELNVGKPGADSAADTRLNMQSTYLCGAQLQQAHLQGADLSWAHLQRAHLDEARLQGADLSWAHLQEAHLGEARLRGAHLGGAQLQEAHLGEARLQGAHLGGAQLQGAHLGGAQLQEAHLGGAQLQGADLREARLRGAHLGGAQLQEAHLGGAQLQGADLREARLRGAHLGGAQLQEAHLGGAQLQEAHLSGAQLQGAYLREAHLQGADLRGAHLQGVDLREAHLQGADLREARLQGAHLGGAQLQEAHLSGAQLQGARTQFSGYWRAHPFEELINGCIGQDTEIKSAVFSGGLSDEKITEIEKTLAKLAQDGWLDHDAAWYLCEDLRQMHTGEADHNPPGGAITGILTKEMAEQIIADYHQSQGD